ncbi:ABC transporter substrate-binding protein [Pseudooceanicola spongiae]|mgnify:FL=1|uniref:PhnD/SsuA/transferrin family substrate-binding protein n=1 Tax=Pseudooceanicola spongiae TaxID=2613965 RepID=A0A7L9WKK6_9RHOB|nr:ABC transporter substrate-binding protein [Pseudooceanicola spongiae]QOL79580.1 PhnD/SsuA/transferrin family substrate-binding protein [Pseudooceanicola spongiae]
MFNRRQFLQTASAGAALATSGLAAPAYAAGTKVLISDALRLAMYSPLYVADNLGLFAKHGLDAEVSTAGGIALPVPLLLSGRSQFGVTSPGMSVNAVREGGDVRNIAKIVGGVSMWAMAKPGSGIKTVDDLRGKTIATLKFPSSTIQVPTYLIKEVGGFTAEEGNVTFLELPSGAQATAVRDGRADVATAFEWDISVGASEFGLEPVLSFADMIGPLAFTTAMTTGKVIEEAPDTVQAFCDALAEAMTAMHADHTVFTDLGPKYFPQVSEEVIKAASVNFFGSSTAFPTAPTISEAEWDNAMKLENGGGAIKDPMPYAKMVDNSFATRAAEKFGA